MDCTLRIFAHSGSVTHKGNLRDLNEDAFYSDDQLSLWCIADGMGGYDAGEVAAALAVERISQVPLEGAIQSKIHDLSKQLELLNQELLVTLDRGEDSIMGCTVVVAVVDRQQCACLWAGDSRLYLFRDDFLYQMSTDHSLVQEMVDRGIIAEQDRASHPKRHIITRALGVHEDLILDSISFDLVPGDCLLLCSDGLYSELAPDQIASVMACDKTPLEKSQQLVDQVLLGAAKDNITVSVIEIVEGSHSR